MLGTVATNIRLPEEVLKALKHKAVEERKSLNQIIREAVEKSLGVSKEHRQPEADAFEEIIGAGRSGTTKGSTLHDRYLYGTQQ